MSRSVVRLTRDNIGDLPGGCRECVFWEHDAVHRERAVVADAGAAEKDAWLSRVLLEWGSCGRIVYVDGVAAGYALYAPPAFLPGAASFPTAPVSEDAVLLATAAVLPEFAGGGLGRLLLQAVVKDLLKRGGIRAVEAFGDSRPSVRGDDPHGCVLPTDFLIRTGFSTHRPHALHPRMRLELKSVLTWRAEVEAALERLVGAVVPRPAQPVVKPRSAAPRATTSSSTVLGSVSRSPYSSRSWPIR